MTRLFFISLLLPFLLNVSPACAQPAEQLLNPGFEADGASFVNPPMHWQTWSIESNPDGTLAAPDWGVGVDTAPRTGTYCAGKVTNWGLPNHGYYQQVTVIPGAAYECSAWGKTWATVSGQNGWVRVGVDPTGGTDPRGANVVWTPYSKSTSWARMGLTGTEAVVAQGNTLTLFLELWKEWRAEWNSLVFDDASVWGPLDPPTPTPTFTPGPSPTPTPTVNHAFGAGGVWAGAVPWEEPSAFNHRMLGRLRNMGVTTNIWGIHWAVIEETQGVYDWSRYDWEIDLLSRHGMKPVGLIVTSPAWASFSGEAGNFPPGAHAAQAFEDFCEAAAARYGDRLYGYSFWNEPDIIWGWGTTPDPSVYAEWQKHYYVGVKRGDPDGLAGTGGFLGRSLAHIEALYDEAGAEYFDAVAIHPYPDLSGQQGQPYFDNDMITTYRSVMEANGDYDTPMWCTEFGWLFDDTSFANYSDYLEQSYNYMLSHPYVTLSNLHIGADWDRSPNGAHMGIMDVNLHPRPPYWDYYRIARSETPTPRPTPPPAPPVLSTNGDFSGGLTGWTPWHNTEFLPAGSVFTTPDAGRSGNGVRIEGGTFDGGVYQQVGGLDPNHLYQMVGWARCTERDEAMHFTMIGADPTGQTAHGPASSIEYDFMAPAANEWRRFVSPPFHPEGTTATLWLRGAVRKSLGRTVRVDFDDVELVDLGPSGVSTWRTY